MDILTRFICLVIVVTTVIMILHKNMDDYKMNEAIIFNIVIMIFAESFFFVNLKAKAKLFLRIKVSQR